MLWALPLKKERKKERERERERQGGRQGGREEGRKDWAIEIFLCFRNTQMA